MALIRRLRDRIAFWRWYLLEFRPIAGAEEDPAPDPKADPDPKDPEPKGDPDPDPDPDKVDPEDDWKVKARKHERAAKREREAREKAEKEAAELRKKGQSAQEKAIEEAREKARTEVLSEVEEERRADRLEAAVSRIASRGVQVGEGDDAKTLRFADSEDALVNIERAIARGDIDADDIFDDKGKVDADALQSELGQLLERKPHLADGNAEGHKPKGDPGLRKGDPAQRDLEAMGPEDHAKRKYGATK